MNRNGLLSNRRNLLMLNIVIAQMFADVMMRLDWLLLPMSIGRRVSSHATWWCTLLYAFLYRTQLLRFFFMLVPMRRLLRYRQMMLVMFRHASLTPALRGMLNECTGIVNFGNGEYRPLF